MTENESLNSSLMSDEAQEVANNPNLTALFTTLKRMEPTRGDVVFRKSTQKIGLAIEVLQPIALVLNPHFGWSQNWIGKSIYVFLGGLLWDPELYSVDVVAARAMFWIAAAVVLITGILIVSRTAFDNDRAMRVMRIVVHTITSPLSFPLLHVFLSRIVCNEHDNLWLFPSEECYSVLHLIEVVVGCFCFCLLCIMCLIIITTIYETEPSVHIQARACSKVDIFLISYKISSSLCFHLLLAREMVQELCFLLIVLPLGATVYIAFAMPYSNGTVAQLKMGSLLVAIWGAFVAYLSSKDEHNNNVGKGDADVMIFLIGVPIVALIGAKLSSYRLSQRCVNHFNYVLAGNRSTWSSGVFPMYLPDNEQLFTRFYYLESWLLELETERENNTYKSEEESNEVLVPYIEGIYLETDIELASRFLFLWDQHFGTRPSDKMLAMTSRIFTKGMIKFYGSREVQVQFAAFLIRYLTRSHIAIKFLCGLEAVQSHEAEIATQYKIFKMSNELRAGLGIRDRSHSLALEQARIYHKEALELMHSFWIKIGASQGKNLKGLAALANQITDRREKARLSFKWMLSQHAHDVQVLGQFASFLLQVMLDQEAYEQCLEKIDTINSAKRNQSKATSTIGSSKFTMLENGATGDLVTSLEMQRSSNNRGSRTVKVLQLTIRTVFIPLILLLVANFLFAYLYIFSHTELIEQMYSAGQVRFLSQRAGTTLQQLIEEIRKEEASGGQTTEAVQTLSGRLINKLKSITNTLEAHHNKITFGDAAVSYPPHVLYLKKRSVPIEYYETPTLHSTDLVSLWSLGNLLVSSLSLVLQESLTNIPNSRYTVFLLTNLVGPVSHAFNKSSYYTEEQSSTMLSTSSNTALIIFITSIVMVFIVYLMFVWNFNKIASSKINTLELFTQIPSGTLSTTADEAKAKLDAFDVEKEFQQQGMDELLERLEDEPPEPEKEEEEELSHMQLLTPTSDAHMAMSAEEALDSLSERKPSIVAIVLKRGLADNIDMIRQEKARIKSPLSEVAHDMLSETFEREKSIPSNSKVSETSVEQESKEKVHEIEESETAEKIPSLTVPVLLMILAFVTTVSTVTTTLIMDIYSLADPFDLKRTAYEDILELKEHVTDLTRNARLFSQQGDIEHYDAYMEIVRTEKIDKTIKRLWDVNLDTQEIELLEEARDLSDTISKRNKISMVLTQQYRRIPDLKGLNHITWGHETLPDFLLNSFESLTSSQYKHSSFAEDYALPNEGTASAVDLIITHIQQSYVLASIHTVAELGESTQSDILREAVLWKNQSTTVTAAEPRLLMSSYTAALEIVTRLVDGQTVISTDLNDRIESYASQAWTVLISYFPALAVVQSHTNFNISVYEHEKLLWEKSASQCWNAMKVRLWAVNHELVRDPTSAATIADTFNTFTNAHQSIATSTAVNDLYNKIAVLTNTVINARNDQKLTTVNNELGVLLLQYADIWKQNILAMLKVGSLLEVLELKFVVARASVFDHIYILELRHFNTKITELSNLLIKRLQSESNDVVNKTKAYMKVSTALQAVSLAVLLSVLFVLANTNKIISGCVFSVFWIIAASTVLLVMVGQEVDEFTIKYSKIQSIEEGENRTLAGLIGATQWAISFVQLQDMWMLTTYWDFISSSEIHDAQEQMISPETLMDTSSSVVEAKLDVMKEVRTEFEEVRWLERIAFRMMFDETTAELSTHQDVPALITTQTWNRSNETQLHPTLQYAAELEHPDMYTTFAEDMQCATCTRASRLRKVRYLLTSRRYLETEERIFQKIKSVTNSVISNWDALSPSKMEDLYYASIILIYCGIALLLFTILGTVSKQLQNSYIKDEMEVDDLREHFSKMKKRCRIALGIVVVVLVVLFSLIYTSELSTENDVSIINMATARQWAVLKSLIVANKISADSTVDISGLQHQLKLSAKQMRDVREKLYFDSDGGTLTGFSNSQDSLLFGPTADLTAAQSASKYKHCTEGGTFAPSTIPVDSLYLSFVTNIDFIANSADTNTGTIDRSTIIATVATLNAGVDTLLEGLQNSLDKYKTAASDASWRNILWCTLASVGTMLLIFLEYQFVFLPMISQLVNEEDGTKLMLNMIPLEVRESVPEIAEYFTTGKVDEEEKMKKQLQQSEKLLQNILPPIISRRLKAGEALIADDHAKVTVAFCALVGFDEVSKNMSAKQIVGFLNDLYSRFDETTDKLNLEKIKTIGDIYFMCGGLTDVTKEDHPLRVVDTVLQFFDILTEHNNRHSSQQLLMKAGINTGPAVAGVIGSKKVAYDLWGDAVNVASRLCGTGLPGKIAVYPSTQESVSEYFSFHEKWVEAKGKGRIMTYILESRIKPTPFAHL